MLVTEQDKEEARALNKYRIKSRLIFFAIPLLVIVIALGFYHAHKILPQGLNYASQEYVVNETDIQFLFDTNYIGPAGNGSDQVIFDTMFKYINEADQFILIDMFLFNDWTGDSEARRRLTGELANHLIAKKQAKPDIKIDFITDPINTGYGAGQAEAITRLRQAGVEVIITDLRPMIDSNPWYSAWWRTFFVWFGNSPEYGWLPHPFSRTASKVTLRTYLSLLNFKANHRKVMVADNKGQLISIVGSANPHDASSANSNAAVLVRGRLAEAIYQSESAVAKMSNRALFSLPQNLIGQASPAENKFSRVQLITEHQIKQTILTTIDKLQTGDEIKVAMFYLADRDILKALINGSKKGISVKIILDANQNAFGYHKIGLPNKASAKKLFKESKGKIEIKWAKSMGEQFHAKIFLATNKADNQMSVIIGSANLTRRNLDNYNLESDLLLKLNIEWDNAKIVNDYFDKMWLGKDVQSYVSDYQLYSDVPWWLSLTAWFQESTGLSSF